MPRDAATILKSSTYLFDAEFVEQEDLVHAVVWPEDGNIVTESGSKRVIFFNLERNEEFDRKGIVFKPKNHRIGRKEHKDYLTVDEVLLEVDEEIIEDFLLRADESKAQTTETSDNGSVDPFETAEVNQKVESERSISIKSSDSDLMSDIDVHKL